MSELLTSFAVSQSSQHIWTGCETGLKIKFAMFAIFAERKDRKRFILSLAHF